MKASLRFRCDVCGYQSYCPSALKKHMVSHEAPRFGCSMCEKMFKSQKSLEAHEREHRGERPFPCPICSAGFTSHHGLDQHVKGTHKVVGPKGGKAGWVHGKNNQRRSYL